MNIIEQAAQQGVHGFLHPEELTKLMELATGREVLEVGAFMGLSAWGMAQTAKSVLSVDTFQAATDGQRQIKFEGEYTTLDAYKKAVSGFDNVDFYIGRSDEYGPSWKSRQYDMVFLDATHTYDEVFHDIYSLYALVREGGVLVLHDYGHADFPGVKQAADEVFGPAPEGTTVVTLRWIEK